MTEKEVVVLKWDDVKVTDFKPKPITREVGKKSYILEYKDINGDTYEDIVLKSRMEADTDRKAQKNLSMNLRQSVVHSIAGKEYNDKTWATMDREMPPWIKEDIEQFLKQYIQGNL